MNRTPVFVLILFTCGACEASTTIKSQHLSCNTDQDCVMVSRGECCPASTAVNKQFISTYSLPEDERCKVKSLSCPPPVKAQCEHKICVSAPVVSK